MTRTLSHAKLFATAFLITINVLWLGVDLSVQGIPERSKVDSVTPVADWCNAAEVRKQGWGDHRQLLKATQSHSGAPQESFSGGGSYTPTSKGVK